MYDNGQGVPQNYAEALKWYRLAADQGDASAQNNLGVMYAKGQGVPQNYAEALKWYRLAADQGNASAQSNLGFMYDQWPWGAAELRRGREVVSPRRRPGRRRRAVQSRRHVRQWPGGAAGLRPRPHVVQLVSRAGQTKMLREIEIPLQSA